MKIASRMLLIVLLLLGLSLPLAYRAYAMSQVTLQNNTNVYLHLYIDDNWGCGPVMPHGFCTSSVTPGGHWLTARKAADNTNIKRQWMEITDGTSPVWTVEYEEELDIPRAEQAVMSFYRTRGEWAGVFVMDSILRIKPEKLSDRSYILNVEYHYTPIPNNRLNRTDSGVDQRVFTLEIFGGNYTITSMGGYHSAQF
jgi:hypothetical protein